MLHSYFAFPSAKMDSVLPGRTCTRDLYSDMFAALSPKGIKMMFYYPSLGVDFDEPWHLASKYDSDPAYFAQLQYDLVSEIGNRYGTKLAGWWVDNVFDSPPSYTDGRAGAGARYNFTTYANSLRSGNPNRLVAFNVTYKYWNSTTAQGIADYAAGEENDIGRTPSSRFAGEGNTQWHSLVWMDDFWVHSTAGTPTPKYGDGRVANYIRQVTNAGGSFTYNAAPFQDSLISAPTLRQLTAINAAVHANRIDDRDGRIAYGSGWNQASNSNYYTGTSTYAYTSGSSATYAFSGRSVKWYGVAGPDHGLADVYIDGSFVKTVDCYAQYWSANTPLFYQAGLATGNHTLVITAKGQHSSAASANYVEVDALEAANGIPTVTDDRNGVAYAGSWSQTSNNAYANGTGTFSTTAGSTATFGFTGTAVRWYGVVGPDHGKADVYIDNVLIRTSDSYDPTWSANALLFAAGALSNSPHTLKIVVRGDRNAQSSNNYLEVDSLEVE